MDVLGFVVPELSRLDLSVLTASASALYSDIHSDLSAPKRQKLRAAKEAHSHKYVRYDIWLGAVHVVLPESNSASVDETRSILSALLSSDVAIRSDPKRVEAGAVLDATSIYDNVSVSVSSANVLLTNGEREWMRREVQEEQNLYIVDDFNVEATIGLSIAPSEASFARTRVAMESEMMRVRLTREKYLAVMRFARAFGRSVSEAVESSEVDFASLKSQAIQMASNAMAVDKSVSETGSDLNETASKSSETITPSEELPSELISPEDDLQQSHLLSVAVHIAGVSVLIEEVSAANEHMAIVKTLTGTGGERGAAHVQHGRGGESEPHRGEGLSAEPLQARGALPGGVPDGQREGRDRPRLRAGPVQGHRRRREAVLARLRERVQRCERARVLRVAERWE